MRPKQFLLPEEAFQEKRPLIFDRVFYVPVKSDDKTFAFPGWNHESLFGNDNPIVVEYCSGNGAWIADKAKNNPHINWVAIEMQMVRGKRIWSKIQNHSLPNLIALIGEGGECTKRFIHNNSLSEIYINFPDPWPKRRHAKNRIINSDFVQELVRVLKDEGFLTLVTDDEDYSKIMIKTVLENSRFTSAISPPYYMINPENFGDSFFDKLWRDKGKQIRLHKFQKKSIHAH